MGISNGRDGALVDALRGESSIFDRARFLGPKKSNPAIETCTSLFGPKSCPNREVSNGTDGALHDALTVIRSILDDIYFFDPEMMAPFVTLIGHFSACVDPFGPASTGYVRHLMGHVQHETTIPIGLTRSEISVIRRMNPGMDITTCVDFY